MNVEGLLDFQVAPAIALVDAIRLHGAALDGSDCGVGKTYHAAAVIRTLDVPTLVVCPKISVTAWNRVLEQMGTGACVKNYEGLATGRTPYGSWEHPMPRMRPCKFVCESCQQEVDPDTTDRCRLNSAGIHCVTVKTVPHDYGKFQWYDGIKLLVFDEVHRCGALESLNADMLSASKRQHISALCLSATAADSPLGLKALGYVLGLHGGPRSFYSWAMARGCKRPVFGGLHFLASEERKKQVMATIHRDLFPSRGVRVRVSEIPGFPRCHITAELFDLETSGKLADLYKIMEDAIDLLNKIKLGDKAAEHPLTCLLRASQQIELLKVPLFIALRDEALDEGKSVALFVNYKQTMNELLSRMKIECCIRGEQTSKDRDRHIENFQAEREHTIVANTAAGGVSVSLHHIAPGVRPRVGICSVHPSATKIKQVFGRLARAGGLSPARYRMVLVANSPEECLHKRLSSKLNCLDALNDSDLTACNLPLSVGCLAEILEE